MKNAITSYVYNQQNTPLRLARGARMNDEAIFSMLHLRLMAKSIMPYGDREVSEKLRREDNGKSQQRSQAHMSS